MAEADESLDRLENKLQRLKREYDLFFQGQSKEPFALRTEIERDILRISRQPFPSTAARFRMSGLAHRFRAIESQVRNLLEQRNTRRRESAEAGAEVDRFIVDRSALSDPTSLRSHFERFHKLLAERLGSKVAPPAEALLDRLTETARRLLDRQGVRAVRFTVAPGEGGPRIRGEVVGEETEGDSGRK